MKLTNFHIAVTSFAALAGVALAAYQVFGPPSVQPVNVTVAVEAPGKVAEKGDAEHIGLVAVDLGTKASFAAALKDDSDRRYRLADLFDKRPETFVTLANPDRELNVLVSFGEGQAATVTALEYTPPPGADPAKLATVVDLTVLPDGQMEASGRPIMSFSLQRSPESQTFAIPGNASGKGLWLRIAGPAEGEATAIGDFRILQEGVWR